MSNLVHSLPNFDRLELTECEKTQLADIFARYSVENVMKYVHEGALYDLPYVDFNEIYISRFAKEYCAFSEKEPFDYFASILVIRFHHLTGGAKRWLTGRERSRALRKIREDLAPSPISVFSRIMAVKGTDSPVVRTVVCIPFMESPPDFQDELPEQGDYNHKPNP